MTQWILLLLSFHAAGCFWAAYMLTGKWFSFNGCDRLPTILAVQAWTAYLFYWILYEFVNFR